MSEHVYAATDFESKWNATISNLSVFVDFLIKDRKRCGKDFPKMGDQFMNIPLSYAQGAFASFTFLVSSSSLIGEVNDHIATAARINAVFMERREEFFTTDQGYGLLMRRDAWWTYVTAIAQLFPLFSKDAKELMSKNSIFEDLFQAMELSLPKGWVEDTASNEGSVVKLTTIAEQGEGPSAETGKGKMIH